ncbi:hypothetical protein SAMN05414137_108220 [Streptacidiphilus jiangxiensis]|uniref:Uncharacterized protein n=2 Tax=Streptacidiphilus jiangxiensis TaxID=235985 RepID=A0A1H7PZX5_STRJI|nr:hypothetical protein SAMN05414137_108220 [Streptacidiphilus jiangxiensis]
MAFSADELRVLRRALAHVLNPPTGTDSRPSAASRAAWVEDVQDMLRLSEAIEEAVLEGGRMRAFALAELVRYRTALPGSASGYLQRLEEAVADGYLPDSEDLAALRALNAMPCAQSEHNRRALLRKRCAELAEAGVRRRLDAPGGPGVPPPAGPPTVAAATVLPTVVALAAPRTPAVPAVHAAAQVAANAAAHAPQEIPRPPRIASVSIGGKVADFARANRPTRLREPGSVEHGRAESYPLPIRRGGTSDMSSSTEHPAPGRPAAPQGRPKPKEGEERPVRPIPTPGDLFPRGVRPEPGQDEELATGTG